jgi:hypothetical protein
VITMVGCFATGIMQCDRNVMSDPRMRPILVLVSTPNLHLFAGIRKGQETVAFRHSARNLLLNASMKPLSVGLPGREKSSVTLFA